ncbi:MAG TPA: MFS transporter [Gemmatimonadales bacterium]
MPAPNPFTALRHRNFRLFFAGQFISLCGTWMQTVAQGWLVLQLTNSAFKVGLVSTLGSLPILAFTLYGGVLADRVNKHRGIILFQSLMMCEALTLGVLTATGRVTVAWVMALAVFLGTLSAFEVPFRQSFVIEMVGREDLLNAIALNSSVFNLSRIIGPVIAAAVIAAVGLAACFFANAASFLAVIIAFLSMRGVVTGGSRRQVDGQGTFQEGVRYAMGEKVPRSLLLLTATFSVFGFSFLPMMPVYARNVLGVGATGYGGLMSAVGLGASVGALAMAALGSRARGSTLIRFGGLMFSTALALVALVSHYWLAAFLLGLAGCSMILNNVMTNSLLQTQAPDDLRGRIMGFYSLMVLGMAPFGSLQAGWISEHFGVRTSLALGGTVCAIATVGWGLREDAADKT